MSTVPVPFSKLETYDKLQFSMIRVHDAFKAGFDSIMEHLEKPPLDDLPNFVGYCTAWAAGIASHHDTEGALNPAFCTRARS
ncbi:hypothetical protein AURDEDRAFT_170046 [Auricularia subglabra TFB-10046 SS5]|uniref:Hemerythrin-like domain-containing protein n=1 Tax=Auricularia subglabra (strain TFB-10046 / SS5) TaxID=717982 RepID=J0WY70_AURST|nr:hypothetical protein AURDEDRAFT_170046 [Auricularia subglabra TFB-10046 SS5]